MPRDKDLKRLVRRRMAETGEHYITARASFQEAAPPDIRDARALLRAMYDRAEGPDAWKRLRVLPSALLRRVTVEGLRHEDWRIRRGSARLLDDLSLTDESARALARAVRDPHPKVRMAAFHALVCEGCKPDGCGVDVRALVVQMLEDPDADVRERVLLTLWDPRLRLRPGVMLDAIRRTATEDRSRRVRDEAQRFLDGADAMRKLAAAFDGLPPALKEKAARHAGKWVAIAGGTVISADRHAGQVRRDVKGKRRPDAAVFFVPDA